MTFAAGRYSVPTKPDIHTVTNTTTIEDKQTDKNTHKVTTITEDCKTGKKVTVITEDTTSQTKKDQDIVTKVDQSTTQPKRSSINISALASLDTGRGFMPVYGVSVNKEVLGPITAGIFGLTNGTVGISIGVNF